MSKFLTILLFTLTATSLYAQVEWRYNRTGIYANETGLLKSWPADGPALRWHYEGLGEGHTSVSIASDKLYVTGMKNEKGYLTILDLNGKLLNKIMYGDEWAKNYPGARATPIISDGKIYLMTGIGELICLDEKTLEVTWKRNVFEDFDARNLRWGFYEAPLVVGEKIIITPGGKEANIVALNKKTGNLIWSCKGENDMAAYCTPIFINAQGIAPQVVTMTAEHILGIDIETGQMRWSYYFKERNSVHPNTPFYIDNTLLIQAPEKGAVLLKFNNGGNVVEKIWEEAKLDPITGHAVIIGDYIYTSGYLRGANNFWYCANRHTGEIMYKDNAISAGAVIYADGKLYCYSEKGEMALVNPTPEKFDVVSKFLVTTGTGQHWTHPVIYKGVLYIRYGDALMAYSI